MTRHTSRRSSDATSGSSSGGHAHGMFDDMSQPNARGNFRPICVYQTNFRMLVSLWCMFRTPFMMDLINDGQELRNF